MYGILGVFFKIHKRKDAQSCDVCMCVFVRVLFWPEGERRRVFGGGVGSTR